MAQHHIVSILSTSARPGSSDNGFGKRCGEGIRFAQAVRVRTDPSTPHCAKVGMDLDEGCNGVPGIMAKIVEALTEEDIRILQSADSNHQTIRVLVKEEQAVNAVRALHRKFSLHFENLFNPTGEPAFGNTQEGGSLSSEFWQIDYSQMVTPFDDRLQSGYNKAEYLIDYLIEENKMTASSSPERPEKRRH